MPVAVELFGAPTKISLYPSPFISPLLATLAPKSSPATAPLIVNAVVVDNPDEVPSYT